VSLLRKGFSPGQPVLCRGVPYPPPAGQLGAEAPQRGARWGLQPGLWHGTASFSSVAGARLLPRRVDFYKQVFSPSAKLLEKWVI